MTGEALHELARAAATKEMARQDAEAAIDIYYPQLYAIVDAAVDAVEDAIRAAAFEEAARVCDAKAALCLKDAATVDAFGDSEMAFAYRFARQTQETVAHELRALAKAKP